jgi:uncharacterized alkaline shock family protein YloU
MPCVGCEERKKLFGEMQESIKQGNLKSSSEKLREILASSVRDVKGVLSHTARLEKNRKVDDR